MAGGGSIRIVGGLFGPSFSSIFQGWVGPSRNIFLKITVSQGLWMLESREFLTKVEECLEAGVPKAIFRCHRQFPFFHALRLYSKKSTFQVLTSAMNPISGPAAVCFSLPDRVQILTINHVIRIALPSPRCKSR